MISKELFSQECSKKLIQHFEQLKQHEIDDALKYRIQGFLNSGEFIGIITPDEAIKLVNDAHFHVFGLTYEERKTSLKEPKPLTTKEGTNILETSTVLRMVKN